MSTQPSANDASPTLHSMNHGFSWMPVRGPFRLITDDQARSFNERGFFLLENAIDPATIERVRDAVDPFEVRAEEFLRSRPDGRMGIAKADGITFTVHLVKLSKVLREFSAAMSSRISATTSLAPTC